MVLLSVMLKGESGGVNEELAERLGDFLQIFARRRRNSLHGEENLRFLIRLEQQAMKKTITLCAILAIGLFCYASSGSGQGQPSLPAKVRSYVGTFFSQTVKDVENQVPTRFEIARARHELANLDGDVGNMIKPIAEYMAAITRLKKEIHATQTNLDDQKLGLLTMTRDLEPNPTFIEYGGEKYSADRVRAKLQRDFDSYKRLESHFQSQKKLLEAKETSLKGAQDQLAKVIAKKREFELRLAQLEADEETLKVAKLGSKLQLDDSRATQIEAALTGIEQRQHVERAALELQNETFIKDNIPVGQKAAPSSDPAAIRRYLEAGATTTLTGSVK